MKVWLFFVRSIGTLVVKTGERFRRKSPLGNTDHPDVPMDNVLLACRQCLTCLTDVIVLKNVDSSVLRHIAEIYIVVTSQIWSRQHLRYLIHAILKSAEVSDSKFSSFDVWSEKPGTHLTGAEVVYTSPDFSQIE